MVSILTHTFGDWHRASLLINHPFPSFKKEGFVFVASLLITFSLEGEGNPPTLHAELVSASIERQARTAK